MRRVVDGCALLVEVNVCGDGCVSVVCVLWLVGRASAIAHDVVDVWCEGAVTNSLYEARFECGAGCDGKLNWGWRRTTKDRVSHAYRSASAEAFLEAIKRDGFATGAYAKRSLPVHWSGLALLSDWHAC